MKSYIGILLLIFLSACQRGYFSIEMENKTSSEIKDVKVDWGSIPIERPFFIPSQSRSVQNIPQLPPKELVISWESPSGKHSITTNISKTVPPMSQGTIHVIFEEGDKVAVKYRPPL